MGRMVCRICGPSHLFPHARLSAALICVRKCFRHRSCETSCRRFYWTLRCHRMAALRVFCHGMRVTPKDWVRSRANTHTHTRSFSAFCGGSYSPLAWFSSIIIPFFCLLSTLTMSSSPPSLPLPVRVPSVQMPRLYTLHVGCGTVGCGCSCTWLGYDAAKGYAELMAILTRKQCC